MTPTYLNRQGTHILYDGDVSDQIDTHFFEPAWWKARGRLAGGAEGRGTAVFLQGASGQYVLRHYRRGGLPARVVQDCYLWTGLKRTRAWREWHLLVRLRTENLPVPKPVAMRVVRRGLCYTADIVIARIPGRPLAVLLRQGPLDASVWTGIGGCIRRFHRAGVYHADLNANNILIDEAARVSLIDFDRGRVRPAGIWREANLARLRRSLVKLAGMYEPFFFTDENWEDLLRGYGEA